MGETISGGETGPPPAGGDNKTGNSNNNNNNNNNSSSDNKEAQQEEGAAKKKQTDQNDLFSLKVKPEFVLTERPSSLGPIRSVNDETNNNDNNNDRNEEKRESGKSKKKRRGQTKKRPRDVRQDDSEKICLSVIRNEECQWGDNCKFSHDLKAYLATRPPDIDTSILFGDGTPDSLQVSCTTNTSSRCYNYEIYGYCNAGAMCRFGSAHINMATGENLKKEQSINIGEKRAVGRDQIENFLPRDVQGLLRKNKYNFNCKRHFEVDNKKDKKENNSNDTTTNSSTTPMELPLRTKKIIDFSNKIYVAPLTTVGNLPFRRIMKEQGADITCGEMAMVTNLLSGKTSEWALLKRHSSEDVFGIQLAAAHPDQFTRVSELIEAYTNVDFVDLNLGCPLDIVCDRGAGACLMQRERKLQDSLQGMTNVLSCPITIKMRTGWDMSKPFAHSLVAKIQRWQIPGIGAIMVHGRSRLQRYQREANWDYIRQVAQAQSNEFDKIPVIGNGDIFSYTEYQEKVLQTKNDNNDTSNETDDNNKNIDNNILSPTAMLGRGALIKPWLPREIKEQRHIDITAGERLDILRNFVKYGLEHWGSDQQGINNTRRFLLEWLSFLHRYVPVGLLDVIPQHMNQRPPTFLHGRNDLETLMLSPHCGDWIKITEMLLGPVPQDFRFEPKHKANSYVKQ